MTVPIRAIYSRGQLRLLDDVELSEGQEIALVILSDRDRVRAALGDLVMHVPERVDEDIDEAGLMEEIARGFRGAPLPSETIIAERRAGP